MKPEKFFLPNIDRKTFRRCVLFFLGLCFLIFGKSISNDYAMDDEYVVLNNAQVHGGIKAIPAIFTTTYVQDNDKASYEYRPIVKATYAIEYQVFGENPHVSHFLNILLYVFLLALLFFVLLRLMPNYHYAFALTATLLFLVHPLHSEVVMSNKNRDVMLSFIGCFLSLLFYLKYFETKKIMNIVWGIFFFVFALLSKKDAYTFYVIIPFTIWFFTDTKVKNILILFGINFIPFFILHLAQKNLSNDTVRTMLQWENPLFLNTTFFQRIPEGFYCIYFYLKMFLFPHPLICYYGYNQVPLVDWSAPIVWIMIIGLSIFGYFIYKNWKSKPVWIFGALYFLMGISMFTNIVKPVVGIVGERFAFIPSVGLCVSIAYLLYHLFKVPFNNIQLKFKGMNSSLWITLAIIIAVFGGRTFARNAAWKDSYTLYATDVENAEESAHTHSLFAAVSIQQIRKNKRASNDLKVKYVNDADTHYREALRIIPDYVTCLNNLGMVNYSYKKNVDGAIVYLQKAVELDTTYVEATFNLANCQLAKGQFPEAEKNLLKTIRLSPQFTNAYFALSTMYAKQKRYDEILKLNLAGISRGITTDLPYVNIGNVYFMKGDTLSSLPYLEKAMQINPNNPTLQNFLVSYYYRNGNPTKGDYFRNFNVHGVSGK